MTPRITRNKNNSETVRRRKFSGIGLYRRRSVGMKKYLKIQIRGRRSPQLSIEAAPVNSWICTSTSWSNMKTVDMPTSGFDSESASSIVFEDFGNDQFIGECMLVYNVWIWVMEQSDCEEETTDSENEHDSYATVYSNCNTSCTECDMAELFEWMDQWRSDEILEENMKMFTEWTTVNENEIMVEEEAMGSPSSKKSSNCTSNEILSTISSSSNTNIDGIHSFYLSEDDEMNEDFEDSSSSSCGTTQNRSGLSTCRNWWGTTSSSESIYDNHDVIVPSGWIDSIRDSLPTTHAFNSDVSSSSSDSFTDSSISDSDSEDKIDSIFRTAPTTRITPNTNGVFNDVSSSSSSSTSDYESETEPVVLKKITTVSSSTQTPAATQTSTVRALAECDELLEKLMEIKKKLKEMIEEGIN